jgi:hypothetical protein
MDGVQGLERVGIDACWDSVFKRDSTWALTIVELGNFEGGYSLS